MASIDAMHWTTGSCGDGCAVSPMVGSYAIMGGKGIWNALTYGHDGHPPVKGRHSGGCLPHGRQG